MNCKNCGEPIIEGDTFCIYCGSKAEKPHIAEDNAVLNCKYCGQSIIAGDTFCTYCGSTVENPTIVTENAIAKHATAETTTTKPVSGTDVESASKTDMEPPTPFAQPSAPSSAQRKTKVILPVLLGVLGLVIIIAFIAKNTNGRGIIISYTDEFKVYDNNVPLGDNNNNGGNNNQSPDVSHESEFTESELMPALNETPTTNSPEQENDRWMSLDIDNMNEAQDEGQASITTSQSPSNRQKIEVTTFGSDAILVLFEFRDDVWEELFRTDRVKVGENGIRSYEYTAEGDSAVPAGTFNVLFCYGINQPTTNLRFKKIGYDDVFVDDVNSSYYNTIVNKERISSSVSRENTYDQFHKGTYSTNIFFDFNGDGETPGRSVQGRGSVRILRGCNRTISATRGDIDISSADMAVLLSYLDSEKNPIIIIS